MSLVSLVTGAVAALFVLGAALGISLVRSGVEGWELDAAGAATPRQSLVAKLVEGLGRRFGATLRRVYGEGWMRRLELRLKQAGNPAGLDANLFVQREAGYVALGVLIAAICLLLNNPKAAAVAFFGFGIWMQFWLANLRIKRRQEIERELPDFLDVLAVTVRSGVAFRGALERVSSYHSGPLGEEIATTLAQMRLGMPRREAFADMRLRAPAPNVATFVTALLQSEELGTPLADALNEISSEIRKERSQRVRRAAAKATPKVSMVATFLMIPATLILMLGGMFFANRDSFSFLG